MCLILKLGSVDNMKIIFCTSCNKAVSKEEKGITMKMFGKDIKKYYCLDCLAAMLDVTTDVLKEKIEDFRNEGCKLFI